GVVLPHRPRRAWPRRLWQASPTDAHEKVGVLLRKVVGMDVDNHRDLPGETHCAPQVKPPVCRAACPGHGAWMNSTQLPSGSSTMPITTPGRTSVRGRTIFCPAACTALSTSSRLWMVIVQ